MKFKKTMSFVLALTLVLGITAYANSSNSLDGTRCTWYGGVESGTLYSKVWDHKVDGIRYNVTVWVKDDNGNKHTRTGTTSGVDADGEIKVTTSATYDHWFIPNKSGYNNFSIVH